MEFNINDTVRVKLTDHGREVHASDRASFYLALGIEIPPYTPPKEDAEGWSEWQLWVLMEAFGPHTHLGSKNCFETTITLLPADVEITGC